MRQFLHKTLVLLSLLTVSCQQNNKQSTAPKATEENNPFKNKSDSTTIDLGALQKQGLFKKTAVVTVNDDPVYHGIKHYNAVPLSELLAKYTNIKSLESAKYQIVFECADGYKPMMPLRQFLYVKSYIAVSDTDAPKGKPWITIIKNGQKTNPAPFYLIYENVSVKDENFKWPYNILKIHIVPNNKNVELLFPKEGKKAQLGFELFKKNCISCHAINKVGGTMGPELNYPKSVTEYWDQKQLKAFIKNPASFRNGVKMPTLNNLTAKDIESIVAYLNYMTSHKKED